MIFPIPSALFCSSLFHKEVAQVSTSKKMMRSQQTVLKAAAKTVLNQKLDILRTISQQDYTHFHAPVFNASVGGHIRHSIDHFSILLSQDFTSSAPSIIDYDVRDRQTDIETNRESALMKTSELIDQLDNLFDSYSEMLSIPLSVRFIGDATTGHTYCAPTSLAREVSFVAHHGIHHLGNEREGVL
jgi:hypothetical protein